MVTTVVVGVFAFTELAVIVGLVVFSVMQSRHFTDVLTAQHAPAYMQAQVAAKLNERQIQPEIDSWDTDENGDFPDA